MFSQPSSATLQASLLAAAWLAFAAPALAGDVTVTLDAASGFVIEDNTGTVERLRIDEATGNISRNGALFVHTAVPTSLFVGPSAGNPGTTGFYNSGFGARALYSNTTGFFNSGFGSRALYSNTTGSSNSAFGHGALRANTMASANSAVGTNALLSNTVGTTNSALGRAALLLNTTGSDNVAVGADAGENQTTGNDNIYIANPGLAAENGQIKIGTTGTHTDTFIAGIDGNVIAGTAVLVTASGELGVAASSTRFKHDVKDMAADSSVLLDLRPVTFLYHDEVGGAIDGRQYGLLAEQVANVAPGLVRFDEQGRPFSVHYEQLPPMLLNEMQKQQQTMQRQQHTIEKLAARVAELEQRPATEPLGMDR